MKFTPIYREWKRNIWSLLRINLGFNSNKKDLDHWLKVIITSWEIWLQRLIRSASLGWQRRDYKGDQLQELCWGVVRCRAMRVVSCLFCLVERWGIKCTWKLATWATFQVRKVEDHEKWSDNKSFSTSLFCFFTGQNDIILYQNKPFWLKRIVSLKWNGVILTPLGF